MDMFAAINKCINMGFAQEDIIIDAIMTSAASLNKIHGEKLKSVQMLMRFLTISSFYSSMDTVLRAKFAYPKVNFRYAIAPSKTMPSAWLPLVSLRLIFLILLEPQPERD